MKQSAFPIQTLKASPRQEQALNAILLSRAGFIDRAGAGIYTFLPLGLRVIRNIERIIREEINAIGGVELMMPSLHPKKYWEKTGRWQEVDILYKIKARESKEYALGPTHEEIIVPVAKKFIQSYKDLPLYLYQIQVKFRDEPRAKSGLLRGREFLMKDLYSFHESISDLEAYYQKVMESYRRIFSRCRLDVLSVEASGGIFSKFSHEFQVATPAGEDVIFYCSSCQFARNREIMLEGEKCPVCQGPLTSLKTAEVGNIFKLGTKFSKAFELSYSDVKGNTHPVIMGCYGIGLSRLIGTIVEVHHDDKGIIWPEEVAPFRVHLLKLKVKSEKFKIMQDEAYQKFGKRGIEVLYDDREEISDGQKLVEADLLGMPWRVVVSEKTLQERKIEVKKRSEEKPQLISATKFISMIHEIHRH